MTLYLVLEKSQIPFNFRSGNTRIRFNSKPDQSVQVTCSNGMNCKILSRRKIKFLAIQWMNRMLRGSESNASILFLDYFHFWGHLQCFPIKNNKFWIFQCHEFVPPKAFWIEKPHFRHYNSDPGYKDPKFQPLCSEIATFDTFLGRYTQRRIVCIGFSDHLVVKPSENQLNLAI